MVLLMASCCLTLTGFVLREDALHSRDGSKTALAVLFGDGRRLFANHFLSKADAYFHRGRYPSIFEMAERERGNALVEGTGEDADPLLHDHDSVHEHGEEEGHVHGSDSDHGEAEGEECAHAEPARGPDDWISRLAARLQPDQHVHLEAGKEAEMLPWIKMAVEMDPHNVDAYTVGGYWLRKLGKPNEAVAFLREGQRNNADSYAIYFELGRAYELELTNAPMAARLYELATKKWAKANQNVKDPDTLELAQILGRLAQVQEKKGELESALRTYTLLKKVSKNPDGVQRRMDSVREQMEHPETVPAPQ